MRRQEKQEKFITTKWITRKERTGIFTKQELEKKRKGEDERPLNVPNEIMVQRMSPNLSGRVKKYMPLDTRDFVLFNGFTELSTGNIKKLVNISTICQKNSCDVLASNRGPSCSRIEQLKGKKVLFGQAY